MVFKNYSITNFCQYPPTKVQAFQNMLKNFTLANVNKSTAKTIFLRKQNIIFAAGIFTFTKRNSLEFLKKFEHWEQRRNRFRLLFV